LTRRGSQRHVSNSAYAACPRTAASSDRPASRPVPGPDRARGEGGRPWCEAVRGSHDMLVGSCVTRDRTVSRLPATRYVPTRRSHRWDAESSGDGSNTGPQTGFHMKDRPASLTDKCRDENRPTLAVVHPGIARSPTSLEPSARPHSITGRMARPALTAAQGPYSREACIRSRVRWH
jgi:hypothetical protein